MNILKPTLIIAGIALCAALALSHINKITQPEIAKQDLIKQESALQLVLPGYTISNKTPKNIDFKGKKYEYWVGEKTVPLTEEEIQEAKKNRVKDIPSSRTVQGFAFITSRPGYSGTVKTMVGIDEKGIILGISILQQTETPGLGDRSTEVPSTQTFAGVIAGLLSGRSTGPEKALYPWFQDQFRGLDTSRTIAIEKRGQWTPDMRESLLKNNAISAITGATITSKAVTESIPTGLVQALIPAATAPGGKEKEKK